MQNLEWYLADLKSTGKNTIETVEKCLTDMFIRLVRIYPCLYSSCIYHTLLCICLLPHFYTILYTYFLNIDYLIVWMLDTLGAGHLYSSDIPCIHLPVYIIYVMLLYFCK